MKRMEKRENEKKTFKKAPFIKFLIILAAFALMTGWIALKNNAEKEAVRKFEEQHFGNVTLSYEELQDIVSTIGTPFTDALERNKNKE